MRCSHSEKFTPTSKHWSETSRFTPNETRAGTALLSIQKETQDRTTISMVGK